MRKRENKKETLFDAMSKKYEIQKESLFGGTHVEISGNTEAIVEGCLGVLEYSDSVISLNTAKLTVRINGADLSIVSFQNGQAVITGVIAGVDFGN
ncbi:MAG: YabP/YqfC family sporulation protein [Clostridia bacterium]|nr:YabP/YqfC family sporulation protein [Clostridia bacterium]